jgi:anaerobic selenocysteine-containing dehydrogenase
VSPVQVPEYYIRQPVVKPLGEVRDFADVCCELAERMGFPLGIASKEEFVKRSCEMTKAVKAAGGFEYMKEHGVYHEPDKPPLYFSYSRKVPASSLTADGVIFDEAAQVYWNWHKSGAKSEEKAVAKGYVHTKKSYKGYVGQRIGDQVYVGFKPDKVNKTGYFEIYSEIMADHGFDPLPTYRPIAEHEAMKEDELILTTFKVNVQTHSRTQNCKWLTEIYHENPAWINPETAAARGIEDGALVKVLSEVGEITTKARVTPAVIPGVVAISFHCGHWQYGRYASGKPAPGEVGELPDADASRIWWEGKNGVHCNWIIPLKADPISGQMRAMDTVVTVSRAEAA